VFFVDDVMHDDDVTIRFSWIRSYTRRLSKIYRIFMVLQISSYCC